MINLLNLIYLISFLGAVLLIDKWLVKKLHKSESEMNELDFVMRPPKWMRVLGLVWVATGLFVTVITFRDSLIVFGFILLGFTALGVRQLFMKIVIKDDVIKSHKFFGNKFTFNEISEVIAEQYVYADVIFDKVSEVMLDQFYEVKCYNVRGRKKLKFDCEWSGFLLMIGRLFSLGILPWFETNRNKKDRENFTLLMNFMIKHDLTTWYSFNKKEAIKTGFKLYKYDLTKKGQYLFTSGAVIKWADFVFQGGSVSDFSLLEEALAEYEKMLEDKGKKPKPKKAKSKAYPKKRKKGAQKKKRPAS